MNPVSMEPSKMPQNVKAFLAGKRIAVTGVSRKGDTAASHILRKLLKSGYEAIPVNPHAQELEGQPCYPSLEAIPGGVHAVMIATNPDVSLSIVEECAALGIKHVWFHRSFGDGSISVEALGACEAFGIDAIIGGCPLMFLEPVDIVHKCMRWFGQRNGNVPV